MQENNPDLKLPDRSILVTRRSDGSGTTYVFTDYLSKVSPEWEQKVGKGKSVPWPIGVGAAGNEGVAWATRNTKYAIGYVELAYAFQNGMTYAYLQNADKTKFIEPNLESVFAAVSSYSTDQLPKPEGDWSAVSITNAPGEESYPIASFTYLLVYEDIGQVVKDKDQAKALVHLIYWMITDGQKFSKPLLYDPLPPAVQELGKNGLARITFNGEKLWDYQAKSTAKSATESKVTVKSDAEKKTKETKKTTDKKDVKKTTKTTDKKDVKKTTIKPTTVKTATKTTSSK
ncbi:MAG: substrate-binding domain-containing protein [Candidatus Nitrosotenuis sp.]|nr:substrate-binding domain-containing protein [Candidatus Nitrosotenuis sp.]